MIERALFSSFVRIFLATNIGASDCAQVENWRQTQITDERAKLIFYSAFVDGKLDAPKFQIAAEGQILKAIIREWIRAKCRRFPDRGFSVQSSERQT